MTKLRSRPLRSRPLRSNSKFFSRKVKEQSAPDNKEKLLSNTRAKSESISAKLKKGEISAQDALKLRLEVARSALTTPPAPVGQTLLAKKKSPLSKPRS